MERKEEMHFDEVAAFHGHVCPGLAIGYRMARGALRHLADVRSADEELVAIVENDACGVDAVQYLTGCTFGKGNLIFQDHGKQAYTLFHRASGRAARVTPAESEGMKQRQAAGSEKRDEWIQWLLAAPDEDVVKVEPATLPPPDYARIRRSVPCAFCGERVMETRARVREGQVACIPCAAGADSG